MLAGGDAQLPDARHVCYAAGMAELASAPRHTPRHEWEPPGDLPEPGEPGSPGSPPEGPPEEPPGFPAPEPEQPPPEPPELLRRRAPSVQLLGDPGPRCR